MKCKSSAQHLGTACQSLDYHSKFREEPSKTGEPADPRGIGYDWVSVTADFHETFLFTWFWAFEERMLDKGCGENGHSSLLEIPFGILTS